nr:MAG TPA: hypothetical protein [Caudoviricetes sp.]
MSKRGSGSSARAGGGLKLPSLEGTPKQISFAEDLRKKWISETLNKDLADLKERKERAKSLEGSRKEFNRTIIENTENLVKAEKKVLTLTTSAKQIISIQKEYGFSEFSGLVDDIIDGSTDADIQKFIKKWAF